jgi:hypothetical protein
MNERVVHKDNDGNDVVSTKSVIDAKGPFGAIDTLDPGARLRVLIETAQTFRAANPDAPVRATELAVNEVLRLRGEVAGLKGSLEFWIDDACSEHDRAERLLDKLAEARRPIWQKLIRKFASFAP